MKRAAVEYFYKTLGSPPSVEWGGRNGSVTQIRDLMRLPRKNKKHNKTILRVLEALENEVVSPYGNTRGTGAGRPKMMNEAECRIAADCLISGIGSWQAWHEVNAWRKKKGRSEIKSRETVRQGALSRGVVKRARLTTKTGSKDKTSKWAMARFAQAKQRLRCAISPQTPYFSQLGRLL